MIFNNKFKITLQIFFLFAIIFVSFSHLFAQNKLPVLHAKSNLLDIREGEFLYQQTWTIVPETKLDVFVTNPFEGTKKVTFYSDIDSISFNVKPNQKYDFVVLLNGKKARTQISTFTNETPSLEPKLSYIRKSRNTSTVDMIPFTLDKDKRIHLKGKINDSEPLDFLFDTGAGSCVITSSIINRKVNLKIDGEQKNSGSDGVVTVGKSSKNTIEIGNLVWKNVSLLSIDYKNPSFDGILGWVAFENKIVEIDYDKNVLVIHQTLPQMSPEYSKVQSKLIGGIPFIKLKLVVNGKVIEDWFDFDTGSDSELNIGQKFAKANSLNNTMKQIGKSVSTGSSGNKIEGVVVALPKMKLGEYEMYQIPMSIDQTEIEGVERNEILGNNILKRFNTIIDFKNNFIYLKPNKLFYSPL